MVNVMIEEEDLLDMLMDRLTEFWAPDYDVRELYRKMYESYIENGAFDGAYLNIPEIVDNDWVNYTSVVSKGDQDFDAILEAFKEGDNDISERNLGYSYIEAFDDEEEPTMFLLRH